MSLIEEDEVVESNLTPGNVMPEVALSQVGGEGALMLDRLGRDPLVLLVCGQADSEGCRRSLEFLSSRRQWIWHYDARLVVVFPGEAEDLRAPVAALPPGFVAYADPVGRIRESLGVRQPEDISLALLDRYRRLTFLRQGVLEPDGTEALEQALEELTAGCEECGAADAAPEICALCGI